MALNMTNFTEIDSIIPLVELEEEEDEEPVYIGFIESSLAKMIPKFFKAIVTLLMCGFLLGLTFFLITLWKRGCRRHSKLEGEAETNGAPLHSVVVTPPKDEDGDVVGSKSEIPAGSSQNKSKHIKVPKHSLMRRASGPFGSEALSFVGEQYSMKDLEKEKHHFIHPHQYPRSGFHSSSSAHSADVHGNDAPVENEEGNTTKSKWNCFRGNKE
ncbi:hypothetical protein Ocin01_09283 [Orchesella cincta]|uniref:Uncharacterized protein n=1 Tax=Orchesella cincta TaxID=48709 RepID=A0A1D2MWR6_ORCCI|nr:hypothetical protein Ocin01_09283 [Orchesella cincta]